MKNLHRSSKELAQIIWKTRTDCPKNSNRSSEKLQGLCEELPQLIGFQWLKAQDLHQFTQTAQTFSGFASNTPSLRQECKCKAHLIHAVYQRFCWLGWVCWICPEPASRLLWLTLIRHIPSVCDWYVWPSLMLLVRQLIFSPLAQSWTRLENTHNSVETQFVLPALVLWYSACRSVIEELWMKNSYLWQHTTANLWVNTVWLRSPIHDKTHRTLWCNVFHNTSVHTRFWQCISEHICSYLVVTDE